MLHIHTSNRLENLAQALATVVKVPLADPLQKEIIVVQSQGMQRWIAMQLAEQLSIWANGAFPFADTIIWRLFKETLTYLPDTSPFEREVMTWSIMERLPQFWEQEVFAELRHYLHNDPQQIKQFQLAARIADLFEQYLVYRPHWLAQWENNQQPPELAHKLPAQWQAVLWRALVDHYGTFHRAKLRADFFNNLSRFRTHPQVWQRLSVFGISALPPFHLEILAELGQIIDVHIFLLNPCQAYWGDIVSDVEIAHKTGHTKAKPRAPEELYFEKGNTLLASWGKMGRDFIDLLYEYPHVDHEYMTELGETSLLTHIQADILHLRDHDQGKATRISADDKSVQIHACHSPMREIEVLHDQLLALFETDPTLLPKDIVVMMPDIEPYAPLIEAVFATTPASKQIPFSIADRSLRSKSALVDAFVAILELSNSRFTVSAILKILEIAAVQRRFQLLEQDLDLIREWINRTKIRWGMDATARERLNLPAFEENTWRAGLNRLLLGYALPKSPLSATATTSPDSSSSQAERLFQGILPVDEIEGSDTLILGKLVAFVEQLFEYVQALEQPRTLPQWATFLTELLERFLSPDEDSEAEAQQIRQVLTHLVERSEVAHFHAEVSREVILAHLQQDLAKEPLPTPFLTGQVLFCTLLPMRSIPFKVVALLGMNDQSYPRPSKPVGFDLIAQHPRRGDRSRRQHDRYLFLEALLSARSHFYISYVGQSIHDNTRIPPSVLVSELLDYISNGFTHPQQPISDYLVLYHPLQAFSPRYFNGTNKQLFSYSNEYCVASTALLQERQTPQPFLTAPLPEPQPLLEWQIVTMNRFTRFLANPTEFFLKERLGIELPAATELLDESEPFEIRGLNRYNFNQTLVEHSLSGMDLKAYQTIAKASGQLPHGRIGDYIYHQLIEQIQPFVERVRQVTQPDQPTTHLIDLTLGKMRIMGRLSHLWRDNLIHYRYAKLQAKDYINTWIHHLILNALADSKLPRHSLLIGEDGECEYQPLSQAESKTILTTLLTDYYWQGLLQPLPFFPQAAFALVTALNKGKTEEEALDRAWQTWRGNEFNRGEVENEYYQLSFSKIDLHMPIKDKRFQELAQQLFTPLLNNANLI